MQPDPGPAPPLAARPAPAPRKPIALLVDDDVAVAAMTAMALDTQGWHTIVVNVPQEAAEIARDLPIDVLVTDLQMPGMSGLELVARERAHRGPLPVVLVSGSLEAHLLSIDPPFQFIAKPFRLRALFAAVNSLAGIAAGG